MEASIGASISVSFHSYKTEALSGVSLKKVEGLIGPPRGLETPAKSELTIRF